MNHELVVRLAKQHARDWKTTSKTRAEIVYLIATAMKIEGYSCEMALDIADEALRYIERNF